jgi:uncharacterized membrane protein YhaH (DUF805 family)
MNFAEAIASGLSHYVAFSGRASRSEFWFWYLFVLVLSIVGGILDLMIDMQVVGPIIALGLLLPGISMNIRRLHDIDRSGWWCLIAFTGIGVILLLVWACMKGTSGTNSYGSDPLLDGQLVGGRMAVPGARG